MDSSSSIYKITTFCFTMPVAVLGKLTFGLFWHCFMAGQQWLLRDKTKEHTKNGQISVCQARPMYIRTVQTVQPSLKASKVLFLMRISDDSFRRCLQGSHALLKLPWRRIAPWCSWRLGDLPSYRTTCIISSMISWCLTRLYSEKRKVWSLVHTTSEFYIKTKRFAQNLMTMV